MVSRLKGKLNSLLQWGKIFFPRSSMKFYPPQFILRDPVLEGVTAALKEGHEVAVVVFNMKEINDSDISLVNTEWQWPKLINDLKKIFRNTVEQEITKHNIITLHHFMGDGFTLYMKVEEPIIGVCELDTVIKNIVHRIESSLHLSHPSIHLDFETGYMFIEKKYRSIQEAIFRAQNQAVLMAQKQIKVSKNELIQSFNQLIIRKNIELFAQPIIEVGTNTVKAWEILTRGPKGTALETPLSLFSVARQTGQLYTLELLIIEKTFEEIRTLRFRQEIFLNCTPLTLGNIHFIGDLKRLMKKYNRISPRQITFEVTESDSIDGLKNFNYNIKMLRLLGFRIAIDDTGSGYSTLSTISEIMPDVIKIDRSLIQNIDKDSIKESMLKGLILVAREAGSLVVAEGIENAEEASVLSRNNVDLAQGFFYSYPQTLGSILSS